MLHNPTSSFAFIINGEMKGRVTLDRGLWQGCPLSPYLFLLCAEGLSATISQAKRQNRIHGLSIARDAPSICHLFFADDSLIFYRAKVEECQHQKNILSVLRELRDN